MQTLGLLIIAVWLGYIAGRIGPDPMGPWETALRKRTFEWRVWWLDERARRIEDQKARLLAWHREAE